MFDITGKRGIKTEDGFKATHYILKHSDLGIEMEMTVEQIKTLAEMGRVEGCVLNKNTDSLEIKTKNGTGLDNITLVNSEDTTH